MYGIILDSMLDSVKQNYGEKMWRSVMGSPPINNTVFTMHKMYDERLLPMVAKTIADLTGSSIENIMEQAGHHFIVYIDEIRNNSITKVLGRSFKDFLNGINCMHEYYRFSFTEMQPPSFHVSKEDDNGIELHYRSRRSFRGLKYYVRGLLSNVAKKLYSLDLEVKIIHHSVMSDVTLTIYRLTYNNKEYRWFQDLLTQKRMFRKSNNLILESNDLFNLFPFHVVFNNELKILATGMGLDNIYPELEGKILNETFFMTRPLGHDLTWDNVLIHQNNMFELTSVKSSRRTSKTDDTSRFRDQMTATHFIKLRGQMLVVEGGHVIFLATFMIDDLNNMYDMGIFVNDLPFHDLSRDMVLHAPQKSTEYKQALDLEQSKALRLEQMVEKLSLEQRKTDDLLYSMIPTELANSLRQGHSPVNLCAQYNDVTVLFSDVVNFANICEHIAPHEVMITLNMMVSVFDILCQKFMTYKVETVADGFMCVSGAPKYNKQHAKNMADMAIEMQKGIKTVKDPHTRESIHLRIGLHCGGVIAGLVGHKIPQYCLFGDTVHVASKLEATGLPERIQISQQCMEKLQRYDEYIIEDKGTVELKGGKSIKSYWLNGKKVDDDFKQLPPICRIGSSISYGRCDNEDKEEELSKGGSEPDAGSERESISYYSDTENLEEGEDKQEKEADDTEEVVVEEGEEEQEEEKEEEVEEENVEEEEEEEEEEESEIKEIVDENDVQITSEAEEESSDECSKCSDEAED